MNRITPMNDKVLSLSFPIQPIDSPNKYFWGVWNNLGYVALSSSPQENPTPNMCKYLYSLLVKTGFKYNGFYEIDIPYLIHVISDAQEENESNLLHFFESYSDTATGTILSSTIVKISPSHNMPNGLYACSLSLCLSNPLWYLEYADLEPCLEVDNHGKYENVWNISEILKHIPKGQSADCTSQMSLTLQRYIMPFSNPPKHSLSLSLFKKLTSKTLRRAFNL